jgi:hypothetical protein
MSELLDVFRVQLGGGLKARSRILFVFDDALVLLPDTLPNRKLLAAVAGASSAGTVASDGASGFVEGVIAGVVVGSVASVFARKGNADISQAQGSSSAEFAASHKKARRINVNEVSRLTLRPETFFRYSDLRVEHGGSEVRLRGRSSDTKKHRDEFADVLHRGFGDRLQHVEPKKS